MNDQASAVGSGYDGPTAEIGVIGGSGFYSLLDGLDEVRGQGVSHAGVLEVFARNVERLRSLLLSAIPALPAQRDCACAAALDGIRLPLELP